MFVCNCKPYIPKILLDNISHDRIFLVGGFVRDMILETPSHDIDIALEMDKDEFESTFPNIKPVGQSFPVYMIDGKEVALTRSEMSTGLLHSDFEVTGTGVTIEEDLSRRDFTIGAMAIRVSTGELIDPFGGLNDIKGNIIRTVGNPFDRFNEDFLRIIRAIRFAGRFNFTIEKDTEGAIMMLRHHIITVAPERIKDELFKMASNVGVIFARTIRIMDYVGILEVILPELKALQNFKEERKWHPEAYKYGDGSPFTHTLCAIEMNTIPHPIYNLSIMGHDLGKAVTHRIDDKGRNRFHSHDFEGVKIFNEIADRFKFSNLERDTISFSIQNHMKLTHVDEMRKSKVAKLTASPFFHILKNTIICDDSCREGVFDEPRLMKALEFAENVKETFIVKDNKLVVVTGYQVMEVLNIKPSKAVGHVINTVTDRVLDSNEVICIKRAIREAFEDFNKSS